MTKPRSFFFYIFPSLLSSLSTLLAHRDKEFVLKMCWFNISSQVFRLKNSFLDDDHDIVLLGTHTDSRWSLIHTTRLFLMKFLFSSPHFYYKVINSMKWKSLKKLFLEGFWTKNGFLNFYWALKKRNFKIIIFNGFLVFSKI